ncbi:MAG: hypothetical protein IPN59_02720 [Holophaga sp.]|nr:hypothetical protein [Holophaga sp.]
MVIGNWLALLQRQSPTQQPIGWDEVVVGYDFGFLKPEEIQNWVRDSGFTGEACLHLGTLSDPGLKTFEACLWRAAAEVTGKAPRPGGQRWAKAQDRWRAALLRDMLEAPLSLEALGVAVETLYERVGCPEDMLGLWSSPSPWQKGIPVAKRPAIEAFLVRTERNLATAS